MRVRVAAAMAAALVALPAYGQGMPCGPRADILAALGKSAREQPIGMGLSQRGYILTLVTSDNARTFSVVAIYSNGTACIVDAGEGWQPVDKLDYPTFGDGT